ncbi:tape measure protein [Bordetella sp. BOR01]|uniref:tape measure protein n=1 Tax=Bordetella sp. BOR01 TaxID=2854779 RepID=UPI001C494965|nr:tape measure protein [Bordetella sp. BOR01]MBV7482528.1 tape measure protein [Bordetella sp. BOR01]
MSENVGSIYYTVEADTAKLVNSTSGLDSSLDRVNQRFGQTDKAAGKAEMQMTKTAQAVKGLGKESQSTATAMDGLLKVIGGYLTLQGVNSLIQMAEGYNEMAERVRFATSSQEEYDLVQQRLLKNANRTYRSLAEAQEVYIRTADSLRSMGYNTEQVLDITDSMSYLFVKNAASVDRANGAISAFTKSINKGKVEADSWESILAAIPSVIGDISEATGKTEAEIRNLGASGLLTAKDLNEGLRQSLEQNQAAADGMATTLKDAFTAFRNNLSAYVGEANQATGTTGVLSQAVIALGENIDTIVKLLMAAGAGALARYIASMGQAAVANARSALAARVQAVEELKLAQANLQAAASAVTNAQANSRMGGSHAAAANAANAHAAAVQRLGIAQRAASGAGGALLGLFGGPLGIISAVATAAAGLLLFSDNTDTAKQSLLDMQRPLDEVIGKFKELTESQRQMAMESARQDISAGVRRLDDALAELTRGSLADGTKAVARWRAESSQQIAELVAGAKAGTISYQDLDAQLVALIQSYADANGRSQEWVNQQIQLASEVSAGAQQMVTAQERSNALSQAHDQLSASARNAAGAQGALNAALAGFDGETGKYLKSLQDRVAALQDGNSAAKAAERYLGGLTDVSDEYRTAVMSAAHAVDNLNASHKKGTGSASESANAAKRNAAVLKDLSQELSLAALRGEDLAVARAKQKLNRFATQEEIDKVTDLAKAVYQVTEAERQRREFGDKPEDTIKGDVDPLSGGEFDDQYARYEEEAKAEEERYAAQLERLQTAKDLEIEVKQGYMALEEELYQAHSDRMAQIEQAKMSIMLKAGQQGFDAMAGVLATFAGKQSGLYKAMFAASKAFAIADAAIQIQGAVAKAWNLPFPANLAAVGTVIAGTATILSSIASISMGGGKQYGGSVVPGNMYRIHETGAPEVLNMANGQQFLLPNQRGEVVSNRDATRQAVGSAAQARGSGQQPTVIALTLNGSWFSDKDMRRFVDSLNEVLGDGAILQVRG